MENMEIQKLREKNIFKFWQKSFDKNGLKTNVSKSVLLHYFSPAAGFTAHVLTFFWHVLAARA